MVLQGDGDSSASEAEVNDNALRAESAAAPGAGLFDNPETAIDSMTPAPPCSSDGWHDIDDFLETAPRLPLAEQGASTSNSIHAAPSPLSSEPLHDSIGAVDLHPHRARSEATTYARPRSPPPRCARASPPKNQLSQEDHLHTGRSVADEHRLVGPVRNADPVDERERRQQEEAEDNDEDASSKSEHPPSLQGASVGKCRPLRENSVVLGMEAIEQPQADPDLLDWEADSMAPMQLEVWPRGSARELSQAINEAGCDSHSGDELNNTESDEDDGKPRPIKRKRPSSSQDGPMHKKPKPRLQQRSTGQHRPRSKPHKRSPKSHPPPDQTSRVAAVPSPQARPSAPHATDTDMSPDCYNLNRSSRAALPTLTEVTFRPHSPHCCSFTAVIRDGSAERGVSFGQLAQLIASIGHVGKIDDFSIKPMEQHSFLLTGFSWHTPSRPSSSGTTLSTAAEAGRDHVNAMRTRPQEGRAVDARALASRRSKPSISDDDSGLSDSDSESSSDDDECSSEGEQGRSSTSKHSRWPDLDEQRLLAYKKEDKSWKWIFRKFPGRTRPAIRTRWNMIRPRGE
jgi:hypothetical protein